MAQEYVEQKYDETLTDTADFCEFAIVRLDEPYGLVLFIVNCILPGIGTTISAFMDKKFNGLALLFGVIQFLFCLTIVVWIWSIWHGYMLWKKSTE